MLKTIITCVRMVLWLGVFFSKVLLLRHLVFLTSVSSPGRDVYETPGGTIIDSVKDHYHLCDNGLLFGCCCIR